MNYLQWMTIYFIYLPPTSLTFVHSQYGSQSRFTALNGKNRKETTATYNYRLPTFDTVVMYLGGGVPVKYVIYPSSCDVSQDFPNKIGVLGGYIDNFEYFNDTKFGPKAYFGFSHDQLIRNNTGGLLKRLVEVLVYSDSSVKVKATFMTAAGLLTTNIENLSCQLDKRNKSDSVVFRSQPFPYPRPTSLPNYDALITALLSGKGVRFSVEYGKCSQGPRVNAMGGGYVSDYETNGDLKRLQFTSEKLITNYQGSGHVYDIVMTTVYSNDTVVFAASDVYMTSYVPVYNEIFVCTFHDNQSENGSVYFYEIL